MNQYMVCLKPHGIVQHCILLYYIVPMITGTSRILCETPPGRLCEGHAATRGAVLGPSSTAA